MNLDNSNNELIQLSNYFQYDDGKYCVVLKYKNNSTNENPKYHSTDASGFDLRANIDPDILPKNIEIINNKFVLKSGKHALIPTGLYFDIPTGYEIQIRPRSGLAFKHGITILNTPGSVDSDYTGEIKIILYNTGSVGDFEFDNGDRIAQAVLNVVTSSFYVKLKKVNQINKKTNRGDKGFNSSGVK